jgi:23S rRNA (cytidine1920-2'-O)/16S rRNA (cytidine1409-2'-O)-methyltransferase
MRFLAAIMASAKRMISLQCDHGDPTVNSSGQRADRFLVDNGHAKSRAEAQAAIAAGNVLADGEAVKKPSQKLRPGMKISYRPAHPYVSRGGVKLAAALDAFGISPEGEICLDLGASTGGFTQVLLERGAARVYAVEGGEGQLHASLKKDARVVWQEEMDVRDLTRAHIPEQVQLIVADLSFISLKLALPAPLKLAATNAELVALVKPQFEVGRGGVASGGIVRDSAARETAVTGIAEFITEAGWSVVGTIESPITGGDGNVEYFLAARRA